MPLQSLQLAVAAFAALESKGVLERRIAPRIGNGGFCCLFEELATILELLVVLFVLHEGRCAVGPPRLFISCLDMKKGVGVCTSLIPNSGSRIAFHRR